MLHALKLCRVVCVGGDGIVHEVVNGLLEKSHRNVGIDLVDGTVPNNFTALPLNMRVGVIPAGWHFFFPRKHEQKKNLILFHLT